jgi:hypothetical protein
MKKKPKQDPLFVQVAELQLENAALKMKLARFSHAVKIAERLLNDLDDVYSENDAYLEILRSQPSSSVR